jgi:hypothetical protein
MTDEEKKLMEVLNVSFEQRTVYYFDYKDYRCEKLSDAVAYAKKDLARSS